MLVVALSITGVGVVLLALRNAAPLLRAHVKQEIDQEDPSGLVICEDMSTTYFSEWHLFPPESGNQRKSLCLNMLCFLLLENHNIFLPCYNPNNWNDAGISDKEGQIPRIE